MLMFDFENEASTLFVKTRPTPFPWYYEGATNDYYGIIKDY